MGFESSITCRRTSTKASFLDWDVGPALWGFSKCTPRASQIPLSRSPDWACSIKGVGCDWVGQKTRPGGYGRKNVFDKPRYASAGVTGFLQFDGMRIQGSEDVLDWLDDVGVRLCNKVLQSVSRCWRQVYVLQRVAGGCTLAPIVSGEHGVFINHSNIFCARLTRPQHLNRVH